MAQLRARAVNAGTSSQIEIQVHGGDEETPFQVLREPLPNGFPPELAHHLADFMARGYNAACERLDPSGPYWTIRGRSIDPVVQETALRAAQLKKDNPNLSWTQIALRVCPQREQSGHRCTKRCGDRIHQAAKKYLPAQS